MPQDAGTGGTQTLTEQVGGTPMSADTDNAPATLITGAGAPEAPLSDEDLLDAIDARQAELREAGVGRMDATAEGVELRMLEVQEYALRQGGYRGSFTDYINDNRNNGVMGWLAPIPPFEQQDFAGQQAYMGMHEGRFYNEARGTPMEVLSEAAEDAGVPPWAADLLPIILSRRPSAPPRRGGTDRTDGRRREDDDPCPIRR